jgi:hypothetical protein
MHRRCQKLVDKDYTFLNFVKIYEQLGVKETDWGFLRKICSGEYLDLTEKRTRRKIFGPATGIRCHIIILRKYYRSDNIK